MLDWRHYVKQNHIKDLPLLEQKRMFLKEVDELEAAIRMTHSQFITTNPGGAAGGDEPVHEQVAESPEIEMFTQQGHVVTTQGGQLLAYN
tara:strand:- start:897 stop:1166 length:270 start_codon:yes stop_codon:yes gene_type:complete